MKRATLSCLAAGLATAALAAPPVHVAHTAPPPMGGMKSNSSSPAPIIYRGPSRPAPPIVAIPRIPGPADMMVASGTKGDVRTIKSYRSNEACAAALPTVRRTISNAFCVSTTPPPPPPKLGFLAVIEGEKELVGLTTFPSMAACNKALRALPKKAGRRALCIDRIH